MLKGHRDTADYLKAKGALPYADLTNVEKSERPKSGRKQSAVKQTEDQSLQRKSPEDQKSLKGKGDKGNVADETDAKAKADAKAKEDAAKAAAVAAAALAAKEAAEKEKAKKAEADKEKADKEKKKLEEKKSPEPAKSPEHSVETKEIGVGKETATVGVVTDEIKNEGEEGKADTGKKQQDKKQKRDPRASPSSVKTEKSIKSQTVPIYVRNQKVGTRMGAQPTKKQKKPVVEEVKQEEAVSPDNKGKDKKHAKFDRLTEDYDSGNETDPGRSRRRRNKYAPHGPNFVDEIHRSVRRYQNNRNKSRQLQQFKRAQIHTGPMHDIVMFSKMMDNHRKGLDKGEGEDEDLDLRTQASWDGYLQGKKCSHVGSVFAFVNC